MRTRTISSIALIAALALPFAATAYAADGDGVESIMPSQDSRDASPMARAPDIQYPAPRTHMAMTDSRTIEGWHGHAVVIKPEGNTAVSTPTLPGQQGAPDEDGPDSVKGQ